MAWNITVEPHVFGDLKVNRILMVNDGSGAGNDTTALTVANMGLGSLLLFIGEVNPASNGVTPKCRALYDGTSALTYFTGTGNTAVSSTDAVTSGYTVRAIAIGK